MAPLSRTGSAPFIPHRRSPDSAPAPRARNQQPAPADTFQAASKNGGPQLVTPAAPVAESQGAQAAANRSVELGRVAVSNYRGDIRAGGHDGVRRELHTYQVGQPIRMSWPNRPGGSGGILTATRCNIFAYNMAYQGGLALPTQHYARRNGPPLSDALAPAQLAAPMLNPSTRDPHNVRSYFQRVDPSQARPGDWVLYHDRPNAQHPHGHWGHVDVVSAAPTTRADGDVELRVQGAGGNAQANREMYEGSVRFGSADAVHGSRSFDRAIIVRPMRARPAGDTDPNASE